MRDDDIPPAYGQDGRSEELLGVALQGRRENFVVATKFGMDAGGLNGADHGVRGSRRYIRRAVEGSLRRLRTDHIDLYQLHTPDLVTPIEETLSTLTDLVHEGKIGYLGCSNFAGWQVANAEWTSRSAGLERFVSVISGATSGAQVRANAAAIDWVPTAADLAELRSIQG